MESDLISNAGDIILSFSFPGSEELYGLPFFALDDYQADQLAKQVVSAVSIGACSVLFIFLIGISYNSKKTQVFRSVLFYTNASILLIQTIRSGLYINYLQGGLSTPSFYFTGIYDGSSYAISDASNSFKVILVALIQLSLTFQVYVMFQRPGKNFWGIAATTFIGLFSVVVVAFNINATVLSHNRFAAFIRQESVEVANVWNDLPTLLFSININLMSVLLVCKLAMAIKTRRYLGLKQFDGFHILFIMSTQTLFIPSIVLFIHYFVDNSGDSELVQISFLLVVLSLPLSSVWAQTQHNAEKVSQIPSLSFLTREASEHDTLVGNSPRKLFSGSSEKNSPITPPGQFNLSGLDNSLPPDLEDLLDDGNPSNPQMISKSPIPIPTNKNKMVAEPVQATVQTLRRFYNQTTDYISDKHDVFINSDYYEKLSNLNPFTKSNDSILATNNNPWSSPPPLPPSSTAATYDRVCDNISKNRMKYLSILSIGLGATGIYFLWKRRANMSASMEKRTKRRVPKLPNGARRDVILIIGSPTEPLTRLIALDFEKRGFIVYLTILDENDFKYIESNPITDDINYLNLNESKCMEDHISKFNQLLKLPVVPFPGAKAHNLRLVGVLFAPSLYFPIGPIENIAISTWTKLNDRSLTYLKLLSSGLIQLIRKQNSKLILINPNILSTLNMPYHAPETIFQNQLKNLFTTLTRELACHGISVTQIRLGNLHISNQRLNSPPRIETLVNTEVRSWTSEMKELYSDDFAKSQYKANPIKSTGRGTSLRQLHYLLFDLIYNEKRNPPVVYCGTGARGYDLIARIFPESWIERFLR
ncbi:uncharacterized protein J8A68_006113 [[Candida] subhashii]|uniref:Uncharacterized protein n=1 Tax=[Candida] subhashii TaxID=561895 RepID=A0A8J5UU30_9ASCO|nr:uncharacterized protein J8A68_006113 [[Candida] subhashii]KAG7660379.1 hypothetical protein J8A68_006113 [[Candida] subhashii]